MNGYTATLYIWDHENNQIISMPKTGFSDVNFEADTTKRMLVVDDHYGIDNPSSRYGCYLFSEDNRLVGFWEPKSFKDFPLDFKTNLLLLGVE